MAEGGAAWSVSVAVSLSICRRYTASLVQDVITVCSVWSRLHSDADININVTTKNTQICRESLLIHDLSLHCWPIVVFLESICEIK
jgi:hypothetical protein